MKPNEQNKKKFSEKVLLGLGLDHKDDHVRFTKGENFYLAGGSEETHEKMTETAIKFNEKLSAKGKNINEISHKEFLDILNDSIPR